jgi:hypothetical protein
MNVDCLGEKMKTYRKSRNSMFLFAMRATFILLAPVFLAAATAFANVAYTFNPVLDYGNTDGDGNSWSYICQIGSYQAWCGFDVSAIPDGETILSASFTASMRNLGEEETSSQRTIWYEPDDSWIQDNVNPGNKSLTELVGTAMDSTDWAWVTFDLDISQHNWGNDLIDNYISLMVTGPQDGEHECGEMDLTESGNLPSLEVITVPEPTTMALLGLGALSLLRRKRSV